MKTVEKIFKSLTNDLNKLYKNYIYLGLTNEEYESICLEAINRNNNPEFSMPQISERVIGNIDKRLKKLLLNTLTNYEDNKNIVLGYVDFTLKKNKNFFNSFDKLVNKADINMIGLLEFLLSNSDTFYKEIEKNYKNNKEMIKAGKASIIL